MSINVITFVGKIGVVRNMITSKNGGAAVSFTVSVPSNRKNQNGNYDSVWYNVKKWYQTAEVANKVNNSLKPGIFVAVTGSLDFDPSTGGPFIFTRKDGTPGASFGVTADNIQVAQQSYPQQQPAAQQQNQNAQQPAQQQQYQRTQQPARQQYPQQQQRPQQQRPQQLNENMTPDMYSVDDSFDVEDNVLFY